MATVLVIDDQSISRMILEELILSIADDISVESFADPVAALEWANSNSHDLVITDYKMPAMNGVDFTHRHRQISTCSDIPLVFITCIDDKAVRYKALEAGATDFLSKPFDHHECRARCKNLLQIRRQQMFIKDRAQWLEREVQRKTHEMELREKDTLLHLAKAGEYRDQDTGNHVIRMSEYAHLIAKELQLPALQCEIIRLAAPMHDIGKIGIPDHILLKSGKLDSDEWETMQTHCQIGYEILRDSPSYYVRAGAVIALNHHERFDGSGYPKQLKGANIPIEARISTVADVFDALLSERPYKAPWPLDRALEYLEAEKGKHFDPDCIDAFFNNMESVIAIRNRLTDGA
ncbi:MAG: HD domain-containing phosphohydrolase [Sedimenticola sp.]